MSRTHDFASEGSYLPDNTSRTGLDVYKQPDNRTVPPPDAGQSGHSSKDQLTIWSYYGKGAEHYDKDLVGDANNTVDVLLIFAGLFSAVVSAFISQTYPMLKPDPGDIMMSIYQELRTPGRNNTLDEPFEVPVYAVRVNCCLFAGLFTSMLVALLGILVKQWTRSYERELAGVSSPHLRARIRHFRYNGAKRWHFASIVGLLSIFMHFALFISAMGMIDLLFSTAPPAVGRVALSVFLLGAGTFLGTTLLPLLVLDAPFRSPLSKFLTGVWRRFRRPAYLQNIRTKKKVEEEGLEDHIEQSQGKESDENSVVRTQLHLDLDIICHLLSTADKSTERWLLDLCFKKLPDLKLLELQDPRAFHSRDIIMEVFFFLVDGCIMFDKRGDKAVNSDRSSRAKQLCKFLTWYLTLPRTEEETEKLKEKFKNKENPMILARLLTEDEHIPNAIASMTALGHLEHFKTPNSLDSCSICRQETLTVKSAWTSDGPQGPRDAAKIRKVSSLLTTRTDCMLKWDKSRSEPLDRTRAECQESLEALQLALRNCNATLKDKNLWKQTLLEKEKDASTSLKDAWFVPLRSALDDMKRVPSFLPPDRVSS